MKLRIEVKRGNQFIPLIVEEKTKVSIKWINPMFQKQGSYSLPFQIPVCPYNDYIFSFANMIQNSEIYDTKVEFRLFYSGILQFQGHIIVEKNNNSYFDANLVIDLGNFASMVSGKKISGLAMGGEIKLFETTQTSEVYFTELSKCASSMYPTYEYTVFPVYAPEFIETDYAEKCINEWDWENQRLKNIRYTIFVYLNTVIKYIFSENGYKIKENIFETDSELNKLVIFNNYSTTEQAFSLNKFLPDITISNFLYLLQQRFCITFFVNDKLKEVKIKTNKSILTDSDYSEISAIADKKTEIVHEKVNGYVLSQKSSAEYENWNELNLWDIDITVDDFVDLPDPTTLDEYYHAYVTNPDKFAYVKLQTFVDEFGVEYQENAWKGIDLSSKNNFYSYFVHDIVAKKEWMEQEYETYNPGDLIFVLSEGNIYQKKAGTDFTKISDIFATMSSGEGLEINTEITGIPLQTYTETISFPTDKINFPILQTVRLRVLPSTEIIGNYDFHKGTDLTSVFLLFYRGLHYDRRDNTYWENYKPDSFTLQQWQDLTEIQRYNYRREAERYPYANNSIYDPDGVAIPGASYSLSFYGEEGQYENFFKEYIHWYMNIRKEVTRTVYFSPLDIHNFDFSCKHRIDNVNYLFSEINIVYHANQITTEDCVMMKC